MSAADQASRVRTAWPDAKDGAADTAIVLIRQLQEQAIFLFDLLDDIDTASDQAKDDDRAYRRMVETIQKRRHKVIFGPGSVLP